MNTKILQQIHAVLQKKYNCYFLLFYEQFQDVNQAIAREKELKGWKREKKEKLITSFNSDWRFLNDDI